MPKFKNREEYEEWKAQKIQKSEKKLSAEPQESPPNQSDKAVIEKFAIPSARSKGNIPRIGWIGISFGISLIFLGISIFIITSAQCDAKCVFGTLFLIFTGLIMAIVFYLIARD
jgi:hypothetical protein